MPQDEPTDYPPMAPVLAVGDAQRAMDGYSRAFGAVEIARLVDPGTGRCAHLEMRLPDGSLLILEERPAPDCSGPSSHGARPPTPAVRLCLFVPDADAATARCAAAGMRILQPPKTHFHGHRCSLLEDAEGHQWMISQPMERLRPSEMQARWSRLRGAGPVH